MREPQARRDQRDIVVPARGREARPAGQRRPVAGPRGRFATLGAAARMAGRAFMRHPGEILGIAVVLGAVSMICLNALGYQVGRHPAPLFPKVAARTASADKPKPVPAPSEPAKETVRPEAAKAEAPARAPRDGIGDLIRAGGSRSDEKAADARTVEPKGAETTASVPAKADPAIERAQRALVKLGYGPLKADGLLGAGTRAAIEKFERDRKLPVKGEASARTLRELAARAGAPRG